MKKFQSKTKRILNLVNLTLGVEIPLYLEVFILHQINPLNLVPLLHLIVVLAMEHNPLRGLAKVAFTNFKFGSSH